MPEKQQKPGQAEQSLVVSSQLRPGVMLDGQIELLELLGEGATGSVFRARHHRLDREVAVKIMHTHLLSSAESQERFKRERLFSGAVSHPGLIRTYTSGISSSGNPYLVMDLLNGKPLSEIFHTRKLDLDQFFPLFVQIMEALDYLHHEGIVHRDLKPSNIIIEEDNELCSRRAILIDFGLSKFYCRSDQRLTSTGAVIGTSSYMSPEQCTGLEVDARSDIYSLGCVMYEALTGHPPFEGETSYEIMFKQLNQSLSKLGALHNLPKPLSVLLVKCLRKSPAERFINMQELLEEFSRCSNCVSEGVDHRKFKWIVVSVAIPIVVASAGIIFWHASKPADNLGADGTSVAHAPLSTRAVQTLAQKLRRKGQNIEAGKLVKDWFSQHPKQKFTSKDYAFAAETTLSAGDYPSAERFAREALKLPIDQENRITARLFLSHILRRLNQTNEAKKELETALTDATGQAASMHPHLLTKLGEIYTEKGDYRAALSRLDLATTELKNSGEWQGISSGECRENLITVYYKSGQRQKGKALIAETAALIPQFAEAEQAKLATFSLLEICIKVGEDSELTNLINATLPHVDRVATRHGTLRKAFDFLYEKGRVEEAIKLFNKLLKLEEAAPYANALITGTTMLNLAELYSKENRHAKAVTLADGILKLKMGDEAAAVQFRCAALPIILQIHASALKGASLVPYLETIRQVDHSQSYQGTWYGALCAELLRAGELDKAEAAAKEGLKICPADHIIRGNFYAHLGNCGSLKYNLNATLANFEMARYEWEFDDNPYCLVNVYSRLALVNAQAGQLDKARQYAMKGLKRSDQLAPSYQCTLLQQLADLSPPSERILLLRKSIIVAAECKDSADRVRLALASKRRIVELTIPPGEEQARQALLLLAQWASVLSPDCAEESCLCQLVSHSYGLLHRWDQVRRWNKKAVEFISALNLGARVTELYRGQALDVETRGNREYAEELYKASMETRDTTPLGLYQRALTLIAYAKFLSADRPVEARKWETEANEIFASLGRPAPKLDKKAPS